MTALTDTPATELRAYHHPGAYEQVRRYTANHELTVLHDADGYKHLRFAEPGTGIWSFEIIAWPGHLTTAGDVAGGFTFSRVPNMLAFFDRGQPEGHINVDYWAEKIVGRLPRHLRTWSKERFVSYAKDTVNSIFEYASLDAAQMEEVREELTDILDSADFETEALEMWRDFSINGDPVEVEWDSRSWTDWDHGLILALHLILIVAQRYHAEHGRGETGE